MNKIYYLDEVEDALRRVFEDDDNELDSEESENDETYTKETQVDRLEQAAIEDFYKNIVFHIDLQTDLFAGIQFPSLPRNFSMLMSKIPWPEKAKPNPNDSLLFDPQKIDASGADDIAKQLFNSKKFQDNSGLKMTLNPAALNPKLKLESIMFEDTMSGSGEDIDVPSDETYNTKMAEANMDVVKAIKTYIVQSLKVVKPLFELTGGANAIKELNKAVLTASSTTTENINKWLESVSSIRKDYTDSLKNSQVGVWKDAYTLQSAGYKLFRCINKSNIPSGMNKEALLAEVSSDIDALRDKKGLDDLVTKYTNYRNWKAFKDDYESKKKGNGKPFKLVINSKNESSTVNISSNHLNEANDILDADDAIIAEESKIENVNYDKVYNELYTYLAGVCSNAIGERDSWKCMKEVKTQMKTLKDRADAEIKKKIEIKCKTGNQKSLVKWPFKAEGLLTMWERYSSELQMRLDNRYAQLTGSNGSVESGSAAMLETFLGSTYPQILAAMITYSVLFQQISDMYRDGFVPRYTLEDTKVIKEEAYKKYGQKVDSLLTIYDSTRHPQRWS